MKEWQSIEAAMVYVRTRVDWLAAARDAGVVSAQDAAALAGDLGAMLEELERLLIGAPRKRGRPKGSTKMTFEPGGLLNQAGPARREVGRPRVNPSGLERDVYRVVRRIMLRDKIGVKAAIARQVEGMLRDFPGSEGNAEKWKGRAYALYHKGKPKAAPVKAEAARIEDYFFRAFGTRL